MANERWDPLSDLGRVQRRMNQLFDSALARAEFESGDGLEGFRPAADQWDTSGSWRLDLELPGRRSADLDIRVEGDLLVVRGTERAREELAGERFHRMERIRSGFRRSFRLPEDVNRDDVRARFEAGVLSIEIPRRDSDTQGSIRVEID